MSKFDGQSADLSALIDVYHKLLSEIDIWFATSLQAAPPATLACRAGCSACCRGLFDITILDAYLLRRGFAQLGADIQARVLGKCRIRLVELQTLWQQLRPPYLLNALPHEDWMDMPEGDETPCPLLGEDNLCLVYKFRPMTCRLHGIPNIDLSGEDFSTDLCTLHPGETHILVEAVLPWHFRATFERENRLLRTFTEKLSGEPSCQADTFIPLALLADEQHPRRT